jgi:hypothetical protein
MAKSIGRLPVENSIVKLGNLLQECPELTVVKRDWAKRSGIPEARKHFSAQAARHGTEDTAAMDIIIFITSMRTHIPDISQALTLDYSL